MSHAKTRKRGLIEKLFSRGLCISYERIKEIKSALDLQTACVCNMNVTAVNNHVLLYTGAMI